MLQLPSGDGEAFPEYQRAFDEASRGCRDVRSLSAELAISGRAGGEKLRGRVLAGIAAPGRLRLEAVAPFGPPVFILAASGTSATLLLPRDNRVLTGEPASAILGALVGLELGPDDLLAILTGCVVASPEASARPPLPGRMGAGRSRRRRRRVPRRRTGSGGGSEPASGRASRSSTSPPPAGASHACGSRSSASDATPASDVRLSLSQVDMNPQLGPEVFTVKVPRDATPITLADVRSAGPDRGEAMNLRAHAKINLSLAVRGVRPDGYHELRTVFQSLALHDTLRFADATRGWRWRARPRAFRSTSGTSSGRPRELVWAAAGRRGEPRGRVRITKRIPAQGGLGGGSADAAAALVGWNRLWATRLSAERLRDLARGLGADVPFFLWAGTALGLERGDEIHPLDDAPSRWVVLVVPPFGVSTPEAFRWWDEDRAGWRLATAAGGASSAVTAAAASRRPRADPPAVFNDLEAPVSRRHPELLEIRRALEGAGAEAAAMTGSGSTVFGLFATRPAARAASDRLTSAGWRTLVTPDSHPPPGRPAGRIACPSALARRPSA